MSGELETVKDVVSHPLSLASVTGVLAWMGNKLWKGYRHEIADMKQTQASSTAAIWKEIDKRREIDEKFFDQMREHEGQDRDRFEKQEESNRDRHDEIMAVIGDLRADIAGLKK